MLVIDKMSRKPIYEQIVEGIEREIVTGIIGEQEQLPSIRELSALLGINPNTAAKAYRELENQGYIFSSVGRGSFLTDKLAEDSAQKRLMLDAFRKACQDACTFGADKAELAAILEETYNNESWLKEV